MVWNCGKYRIMIIDIVVISNVIVIVDIVGLKIIKVLNVEIIVVKLRCCSWCRICCLNIFRFVKYYVLVVVLFFFMLIVN